MNHVHASELGDLLNIRSVFSMYIKSQLKSEHSPVRKIFASIRATFMNKIRHLGYIQLNTLMLELVKTSSRYSVLTRVSLEQAVNKATPYQILTASLINEDLSSEDAMLYLLSPEKKSPYTRRVLLERSGIIEPELKPNRHE